MSKIPESEWKWYGLAGHFIGSDKCRFHLTTEIGKYLISTVGAYRPQDKKMETIGYDRYFETMVFLVLETRCTKKDCNCQLPDISGEEIDFNGYQTAGEAAKGHIEMCNKYADQEEAENGI